MCLPDETHEGALLRIISNGIDLNRIVFTRDNFLKLALIYVRVRVALPVIIMGETGIGKTAVISYLADIMSYDFKIFNMHAGISEQ